MSYGVLIFAEGTWLSVIPGPREKASSVYPQWMLLADSHLA